MMFICLTNKSHDYISFCVVVIVEIRQLKFNFKLKLILKQDMYSIGYQTYNWNKIIKSIDVKFADS